MQGMNLEHIQSGRTTRLIERALQEAYAGRAVYFLVHHRAMVKLCEGRIQAAWSLLYGASRPSHGIKVEVFSEHAHTWDWPHMCPNTRFHPNCRWLVDHTVIEEEILRAQDVMKRLAVHIGQLYPHTI